MSRRDEHPYLGFVLVMAAVPADCIVTGALVATMWRWFVMPLGLHAISTAHAFGLVVLLRLIAPETPPCAREKDDDPLLLDAAKAWGKILLRAVVFGGFAALAHHFMGGAS